mmetsp:Transcript_7978/g.19254  ORF Transcript_7978/g.19254 Transcript_7978/m.19254 type:complete len:347 (+) Transcript_7978:145-1185(+)|eukprot:CAMPEP_0201215134 /NCGR_PEP_ID=MMETSP0851-20130426/188791_1 /ASSEMBLY_ACC=CAM_ASM_000631 /TAXON_ID=183588 /ORGANISM="Pseudo-nitzschia fraudulenta, Strain WWA7" /LENGTH=346 /DNA_ID=CAMNT_0047504553 /DNA_START=164 /DNA_END=1204 /DNA_ORIENTATION=+
MGPAPTSNAAAPPSASAVSAALSSAATPTTAAAASAATTTKTSKSASGSTKKSVGTKSSAKTVTKATGAGTKAKKPVRKKKPATKSSSSTNGSSQLYAKSRAAQLDLASERNAAAARRSDPLWYQLEDYVLPAVADDTVMAEGSAAKILPEQAQIVEAALNKNGLTRSDVTPQAFACLLEQARRYAIDILSDSQDYAFVANRTEITKADLALANEFRPDYPTSISTQLPKLNLLARTINRVPLPPIPTHCYSGVLLPSKRYQLTARTFDVVTSAQTAQRMVQAVPALPPKSKTSNSSSHSSKKGTTHSSKKSSKKAPSYGAARGRQIAIHLKGDTSKDKKNVTMKK